MGRLPRRPVCLVCILYIAFILISFWAGLPLLSGERSTNKFKAEVDLPANVKVCGKVEEFTKYGTYSKIILTDSIISTDSQFQKTQPDIYSEANSRTQNSTNSNTYSESDPQICIETNSQEYNSTNSTTCKINKVKITLTSDEEYSEGSIITAQGKLKVPQKATNPGQFDMAFFYRLQNIGFTMTDPKIRVNAENAATPEWLMGKLRKIVRQRISKVFPDEEAGVLIAMLTGSKSGLTDEVYTKYRICGTAHMLVVSSLHMTMLSAGLFALLLKIRLPVKRASLICLTVMLLYVIFTGCGASAIRAFVMFAFVAGARITGRTYDIWTAIAFAAIIILLGNPYYLFHSGFQLSFICVIFCALSRGLGKLGGGVLLFLGTLPVVLYYFYELPLYSALINLVVIPLLPFAMVTGIIGTIFGGFMTYPARLLLSAYDLLFSISGRLPANLWIGGRPGAAALIIYYIILAILIVIYRNMLYEKKRFAALLLIPVMIFSISFRMDDELQITVLDVGQGDSIVLDGKGDFECLIDGGSSSAYETGKYRILPFLESRGIDDLEYLFVTHMDNDHISGIKEILQMIGEGSTGFEVEKVVLPRVSIKSDTYLEMETLAKNAGAKVVTVKQGDMIKHGDLSIEVMSPSEKTIKSNADENEGCMVLSVSCGNFVGLFTGDIEGEGEAELTGLLEKKLNENSGKEYDFLKVAHHGSKGSTSKEFLEAVKPKFAVISAGKNNIYGHPHKELISRLNDANVTYINTAEAGAVSIFVNKKKASYSTFNSTYMLK